LKVKLLNGNVASRVLPVQIHDLDNEDIKLCESVLGSVLRGIEFIYKESGIDKPLAPDDDEKKNLNNTKYRIQVVKVAHAIKEIITAMKQHKQEPDELSEKSNEAPWKIRKGNKTRIVAVSIIALVLIIFGILFIPKLVKSEEEIEKSIAVLPFSDFSANHDQEYFANGMMEEILNHLTKIKDLEVISRTSSMVYKDSKLPMKTIAHELDVSNIVEGSVQKAGDKVRITVELIDGKSEKNIWSETYDRDLSDIFSVQTEISMNIARELKAILTSQEEDLISQIPTNNSLAYDYYLRGLQYSREIKQDSAIIMLGKAIDEDPEFILPYLVRATLYSWIYFTKDEYDNIEYWEDFNRLAKEDLEKAMKINPDLPEVKIGQADLFYFLEHDNDKALELYNEVLTQTPNNINGLNQICWALRRKGSWDEHLNAMQKAFILDPLNGNRFVEYGYTYRLLRRYPEAIVIFNKPQVLGIQLDADTEIRYSKFFTILLWKGNIEEALKISELRNAEFGYTRNGDCYYYYIRDFDKLISAAEKTETQFKYFPKTLNIAQAYFLKGNMALSQQYAGSAITELNAKIIQFPEDERFYAALGYAYAFKGYYKIALENSQKAVKLMPLSTDVLKGFEKEKDLAIVYILAGEYDRAMDKIEYLLTIPGDLSVPLLKIDPSYDKLRDLQRFQKILETDYKTNYY
jgi:TolB-like protein/Tfp pilus assembly protein PilF